MKIGIDVSMLNYQGSGVANYTFNLVKNLLVYGKENEYRLFYSSLRRPKNFYHLDELKKLGAKIYDFPFPISVWKILWAKYHMVPVEWLIGKVDVFFSSDFLRPPLLKGTRGFTSVHDLTWKIFPEFHTTDVIDAHKIKLEKTLKYRDTVIADSENTKNDLLKYFPGIKNIHVLHLAVGDSFKPVKDKKIIEKVINKYFPTTPYSLLATPYILYVGAIEPRKNLKTAIRVFHRLITPTPHSQHPTPFRFLIVGRAGWKNEEIFKLVRELKLEEKVIFVGFVEDVDLPFFYSGAEAFIYLSAYEGFGLPPVEAAACGTPTLLYGNSSLKEIFKEGYPYTKKGTELEDLKKIIDSGFQVKKYLKDFSWKKYCTDFLKIINI